MAASASSVDSVPGLSDLGSWATDDEARLARLLVSEDQAHLFAGWVPGSDEAKKHAFFEQVGFLCLHSS